MIIARGNPKLLSQKSQNLSLGENSSLGQNFLVADFLSLHRYFIETITTDNRFGFASSGAIL